MSAHSELVYVRHISGEKHGDQEDSAHQSGRPASDQDLSHLPIPTFPISRRIYGFGCPPGWHR